MFSTTAKLSEPVPLFSDMVSEFYVSTLFLLHGKKRFSFKKVCHEYKHIFFSRLKMRKAFLIVVLMVVFKYWKYLKILELNPLVKPSRKFSGIIIIYKDGKF